MQDKSIHREAFNDDKSLAEDMQEQQKQKILVREAAVRLLARRQHSQSELLRKLSARGSPESIVLEVVNELQEQGYQSQSRFTQMLIKGRMAKLYGMNKIRSELAQHNIGSTMIADTVAELDVDWFDICKQAYQKKYGRYDSIGSSTDWALLQKHKRYLWQRGFTEEQISYAMSSDED